MKKLVLILSLCLFTTFTFANNQYAKIIYNQLYSLSSLPDFEAFSYAYNGYQMLMMQGKIKNQILSVVDFNLSSNKERFWVIDMSTKKLLFHTLVAHGKNSGEEFAQNFSNSEGSYQSSLGFYLTGGTYDGKHGNSLKLVGLEKNINDAAYNRGIVIHGADYVSKTFIEQYGRLGRSLGCPAVPLEVCDNLVNTIKNGSCLFIYKKLESYLSNSSFLKTT
jgi:hypothetical protein